MNFDRSRYTTFFLGMMVLSLFFVGYVKALPTIGMLGLMGLALVRKPKSFSFDHSKWWVLSYLIVFVYYLIDGVRLGDGLSSSYWSERLATKVPFLLFPLFILLGTKISKRQIISLYSLFFTLVTVTAIGSLVYYAFNYDEVNLLITQSKNLPVIINHVRYSLLVCFGVFVGLYLFLEQLYLFNKNEKWFYLAGSILLIGFLHVSAVRSGLVAFYGLSALIIVYLLFIRGKRYIVGIVLLVSMVAVPVIAYYSMKSIQNKVANMDKDLGRFNDPKSADSYSLTGRWFSYKVGYALFEQNKLFGTGICNFDHAVNVFYEDNYPVIKRKLKPHNQFFYWLGASGFVGAITLCFGCFFPVFKLKNNRFLQLFVLHNVIVFVSCLVENTYETQLGVNFSVLFSAIPLFLRDVRE